jgi:putative FmdB family regulatory protein
MPVYEYQCKTCSVRFERTQSFKDEPVKVCPECGGETYRVIGATGIIFKGSGFYVNDSKGKNSAAPAAKADKADEKKDGAKPEGTSSTTSETSTPAASTSAAPAATTATA